MIRFSFGASFKQLVSGTCFFFLLFNIQAFAQQAEYFPYYSKDTLSAFNAASTHRLAFKAALPVPTNVSSDYRNHYKKTVTYGANDVYSSIRYEALTDTVADTYVKRIFRQILKSNPNIPAKAIYLVRDSGTNAYAVLDGTVFLNTGLLAKMENESQVAFVLCHELAHVYFKHTERGLRKELDRIYNKQFQGEIKKIVKQKYNINAKMETLLRNASINRLYHNRKDEKQADSLGYVLLKNSGYDASQAYTTMQLLDKIDDPYSKENLAFEKIFTCPEFKYTFAAKPVKTQSIFNIKPDTSVFERTDSLKSHPDCAKRMRYLQQLAQINPPVPAVLAFNETRFRLIREICRRESIQALFDGEYYDESLFNSLLLLREQPESAYLRAMVTLSLFELKKNLENHTYADVLNNESEDHPENFGQLLTVLQQVKVADFKGFAACFNQVYPMPADQNEYVFSARYSFLLLNNTVSEAEALKKQYSKTYKGGRFETLLFADTSVKKKK